MAVDRVGERRDGRQGSQTAGEAARISRVPQRWIYYIGAAFASHRLDRRQLGAGKGGLRQCLNRY